jgi:putative DNA primase/helicase
VIAAFNAAYTVDEILLAHGYEPRHRRFLAPTSTTGCAGVTRLGAKVYSHHGTDPLTTGHAHDPFSLTVLAHGGDTQAAVKAAARALGMERGGRRD